MARRVFFSFHYARDVRRIQQVRQSWVVRANTEAQPFYDAAEFEKVKQRAGGIQNWIDEQLKGTSVTVILYGAETYEREWVRYEIKKSYEMNKGMIAIDIHNLRDPQKGTDVQGKNPLSFWSVERAGRKTYFSDMYESYDWIRDNGYQNLVNWVEDAARAVRR